MVDLVHEIVQQEKLFCGNRDVHIEPLEGGLVNHTYKISTDNKAYFLRISSAQYKHLNLDLAREFHLPLHPR
jgi:fructosamine-3-kinase